MIIENYLQSEPDLYNVENYKALDNKIKNWDGCDFEVFLSSITDNDLYLMLEWLQCSCAFEIDCEYFGNIEESSGYDIAKETVIREYIQRLLMDYIENNLGVNKDNIGFVDHLYRLVRTISFRSI